MSSQSQPIIAWPCQDQVQLNKWCPCQHSLRQTMISFKQRILTFPFQCSELKQDEEQCTRDGSLTSELYVNLAMDQFIPTEDLPKPSPFMHRVFQWMAERKAVVVVRFLRVVVRTNLVDPERNRLLRLVLHKRRTQINRKAAARDNNCSEQKLSQDPAYTATGPNITEHGIQNYRRNNAE